MNLGVVFGGASVEHDISVLTAVELMANIDREKHTVVPIYIAKDGTFFTAPELVKLKSFTGQDVEKQRVTFVPPDSRLYLVKKNGKLKAYVTLDCIVNACHGGYGENGTLAGLFSMCNLPQTSPEALQSALGMNKAYFKAVAKDLGIPVMEGKHFTCAEEIAAEEITFPAVVKPANLGSSIGVSKVTCAESLALAAESAFLYDSEILVERCAEDYIEINCAAVKDGFQIHISECEQPVESGDFLSFADKYLSGGGEKFVGQENAKRIFPAPIDQKLREEIRGYTQKIYTALDLKGAVRMDYLVENGRAYINEINTVPGSLANYLFDFPYQKLIEIMINEAVRSFRKKSKLTRYFSSPVLTQSQNGVKNTCVKSK